jgi:hypothetical protein
VIKPYAISDTSALQRRADGFARSPALMQVAVDRQIRRLRPLILEVLQVSPQQSALPFVWSYNKQAQQRARAWYYANHVPRGSKGGRYTRTGALAKAWRVEGSFNRTGGEITITNRAKGAEFVYGMKQVPSHARSGFPRIDAIRKKWTPEIQRRYASVWNTINGARAGIPLEE